jgi:hypothetical protein
LIPRLNRSNPVVPGRPEWPEWPQPGQRLTGALFEARPSLRRLIVLADAELLASPNDATLDQKVLLTGLLTHPYVEFLRFSDEGPPPDAARRETRPPVALRSVAEGWAELQAPDGSGLRGVVYAASSGGGYTGIWGNRAEVARRDASSSVYAELASGDAAERRERDALALGVAEVVHADLFVTARPYLFARRLPVQGVTVCKPSEALALVGLYLRSQQAFVIWRGTDGFGSFNMNEGLYFWVGTRELLPAAWRWFTACVQQSNPTSDRTLLELGESLLRRVQRALEARDRLHRVFNLPQNNDTARAVLSELDSILVLLMGAADVSARVAHMVLGITGSVRDAGWQNYRRWLPQVATAEPALAALFNASTEHNHALTILRLMRNTVHGQMIRSIALQQPGRMLETAIVLPASSGDEAAILSSMDALGGRGSWGASTGPYRWLVDPGVFIEQLLPRIVTMLNEIMDATPVERLSQVHLTQADCQPPAPDPAAGGMDTFGERSRLSIRWQLGL